MQLVLSLFPNAGRLDRAFEEAGFCVVLAPDLLWGGDVRQFRAPPGRFDGVICGPPCNEHLPAPDMIPEFSRCVLDATPTWWLMENVPEAPAPDIPGYARTTSFVLQDHWLDGFSRRLRRFFFGGPWAIREPAILSGGISMVNGGPLAMGRAVAHEIWAATVDS